MSNSVLSKLVKIQSELKAPKTQLNKFGGYNYRSLEDILEAVKPLLAREGLVLLLSDDIVSDGSSTNKDSSNDEQSESKNYIKVTATLTDGTDSISVSSVAREANSKKGADAAQLSGATSSYARKYALNGLFLIDDTKDADATNDHGKNDKHKGVETKTVVKNVSVEAKAEEKPESKQSEEKSKKSFRRPSSGGI